MAERSVAVRLLLNPAGYTAGAAQVQRANAAMTTSTTATASRATAATGAMSAGMQRTGQSMANVAGQAGLLRSGITTPVAAAGAAVVGATKAAIDWESAWAGVTKTVDGSASQMERLEGDLRDMAGELPATHEEIASVAEAAGQLGVQVDDVAAFSRVMIDLGETTNLSADQAATAIARITNIMGTAEGDVDNFGAALVDLGNNSATTEAEILEFTNRIAAAGNVAGLSEADLLAFGAAMSSVGVRAERGGTALSKVFTSVRDSVIDADERLDVFAETAGMSAEKFAAAFREDPATAIAEFIAGLGEMSQAGESTTAVFEGLELTDQRLMQALIATAEAGDLLTDSIELSSEAWRENIALTEEAENRYDTTAAKMETSWGRIKDVIIDAGNNIMPVVEGVAKGFADALEIGTADLTTGEGWQQIGDVMRGWGVPDELLLTDAEGSGQDVERAVEWNAKFENEIEGLQKRFPQAAEQARGYRTAILEVGDSTVTGTERLQAYQDQLRAATDPVFALQQSLVQVDEAQEAYNDAVDEYGEKSPEAQAASLDLASAVASAEQAALDGELSFDAFDAKLQRWVEQGVITAEQADNIRGRVSELNETSDEFEGERQAQFETDFSAAEEGRIANLNAMADRWRGTHSATFVSNVVSGTAGNLFAGRGHSGGMVTTAGVIPRMHDGGVADTMPRFHAGSSRLASDEVPAILQTGEMVLSREQVGHLARAMAPMARGPMGGGSRGDSGDTFGGGHLTGNLYLDTGEFMGVVQGQVKQGISEHDRGLKSRVRQGTGLAR